MNEKKKMNEIFIIYRVIMMKKTIYLKNIFDSCLYEFIAFTFLLKPLHKLFFTIFTVALKRMVKIWWGEKSLV